MRAFLFAIALALSATGVASAAEVDRSPETGRVTFVGTSPGETAGRAPGVAAADSPTTAAREYLLDDARRFGLEDSSLARIGAEPAPRGGTAVRLQQRVDGLEVMGGEFAVTLDGANRVRSVLGEAAPDVTFDRSAAIPADDARAAALALVRREEGATGLTASAPVLKVWDSRIMGGPARPGPTLVWTVEVTGGIDLRKLVVLDATLGAEVATIDEIHAAKDRRVCNRNNAVIADESCPDGKVVRTEGGPATGVTDVDQAYDLSGDAYDFFKRFGRDSVDGKGLPLRSLVKYCDPKEPCPFENAFWNGTNMVYGEGFTTADDVVAHELSHAVTEYTSRLFYYQQSGAINESLSDVFGELTDLSNGRGDDSAGVRWELGEDLPASVGVVRDMADPTRFGDPDRIGSANWKTDDDEVDNGGVHQNSGVNNKATSLMTDGGTFNGKTVTGLGIDKVARLYYVVETTLLTSASDYRDLGNALGQACDSLVGTNGFAAADCDQVDAAVLATEMDKGDSKAPEMAPCTVPGNQPSAVYSEDFETPLTGRWVSQVTAGDEDPWLWSQDPLASGFGTYATSGTGNLWGYDLGGTNAMPTAPSDSAIEMQTGVAIPSGAFLYFKHAYGFDDFKGKFYDGGYVEYSADGGAWTRLPGIEYRGTISTDAGTDTPEDDNPLGGEAAFVGESGGYVATRVDLSALAGESVRFRFRIGTDSTVSDFGWFIDDVDVHTCGVVPETTITDGPAEGSTIASTTPTLTATSDQPGATFECDAEGDGTFTACTMPWTTAALSAGPHTVAIRARTGGGPDPTPATRTFTVAPPATGGGSTGGGSTGGGSTGGGSTGGGSTPGSAGGGATPVPPAQPAATCTGVGAVITGIAARGAKRAPKVRVQGVVDPARAGATVVVQRGSQRVGTATVAADGAVDATVPAPRSRKARRTATYRLVVATLRSEAVKAGGRASVSRRTVAGGVRITGRVARTKKPKTLRIRGAVLCGGTATTTLPAGRTDRRGRFTVTLPTVAGKTTLYRIGLASGADVTLPIVVRG